MKKHNKELTKTKKKEKEVQKNNYSSNEYEKDRVEYEQFMIASTTSVYTYTQLES